MIIQLSSGGKIDVPYHVSELTFMQFIDFTTLEQRYFAENEEGKDEAAAIQHLIEAVAAVVTGDIHDIPFRTDESIEHLMKGYSIGLGEDISILKIYAHVVNLIQSYTPESSQEAEFSISFNGEQFTVAGTDAARTLLNQPLTAGEAVTVLELQRNMLHLMEKNGDKEGNLAFSLGVQELAVLLRKPGEQLPMNRVERIKFIDERVKLFEYLPLDVVLDIRFFFLHSIEEYMRIQSISIFSTPRENKESPMPSAGR